MHFLRVHTIFANNVHRSHLQELHLTKNTLNIELMGGQNDSRGKKKLLIDIDAQMSIFNGRHALTSHK